MKSSSNNKLIMKSTCTVLYGNSSFYARKSHNFVLFVTVIQAEIHLPFLSEPSAWQVSLMAMILAWLQSRLRGQKCRIMERMVIKFNVPNLNIFAFHFISVVVTNKVF